MQAKLKIINVNDVVKMAPTGCLDFRATKQHFVDMASSNTSASDVVGLMDCRDAQSALTTDQIGQLAVELDANRPAFREKTPVLVDLGSEIEQIRFFGRTDNEDNGLRLHAFDNLGDVVEWLFPMAAGESERPVSANAPR